MNNMNLFIMSYEEIIDWFKPQTESEEYILSIMKENKKENEVANLQDLDDRIIELEHENSGLEYDVDRLTEDIKNLQSEISELEETIDNLEMERESKNDR